MMVATDYLIQERSIRLHLSERELQVRGKLQDMFNC
jgi:hypothetical protein